MSMHPLSAFPLTALTAAVVIMASVPALAQNTTSAVSGRVANADGVPVASATVEILHRESGTVTRATTGADGRFLVRGLRAGGPYTITVSKGSLVDKREDVQLALAETLALDSVLGSARVEVTGRLLSDKLSGTSIGAGTNIGSRELSALASIQRNLQDYARTDPRLAQTDKERGEISAAGQNTRFNSITIDGVTTNDTFGLESNNLPTLKQPISIDAIQSVQVNISNYDVTQKGYTGANINAVTKSGTNDWKGSVYYVYRDDNQVGDRYNRGADSYFAPPAFKEDTKGFTLGGPIIKDKLFFFANYEELRSTRGAPDFGPVGDAKTNVAITPAAISGAQAIALSRYGIDIGTFSVPTGAELVVKDTLLKLDWNISDQHKASVRYAKTQQSEPIFPNIANNQLSLNSNWYTQSKAIETLVGQWFADWTPNFSTELKLSRRDYDSVPLNNSTLPQVGLNFLNALPPGVPASTPNNRNLFFGTERSRHFNQLNTNTDDTYFAGNWTVGGHELKGGMDISRNKIFNAFLQDVYGNYSFRCVTSSATYTYNAFPGGINCATASAADIERAILENFDRGRPFTYSVQTPAPGKSLAEGAARWSLTDTGVFLQDTWTISKALTVVGGVRLDRQSVPDRPAANAAAQAAVVAGVPGTNTRQTGGFGLDNTVTIDGDQLIQPRMGFNYKFDLAGKLKSQVRGGLGLFQGAAASVWLSNPFSNTGVSTRIIGCGGSFAACSPNGGLFSANVNSQPTNFPGNTPAANVDFIQNGLGQPSVWKANLAFDTELPWFGLVAGAEWLNTRTRQGLYYQHLNLGPATRTGSDGRDMFYNAAGYNTSCWTASGATNNGGPGCVGQTVQNKSLSNLAFNNVLLAARTDQGGGDTVTLSLSQQPTRNFGWAAAYTRSTAKEVSPLTSSVANSNWLGRAVFNPNEEVAANSTYLVRDRVSATVNWSKAFIGSYKTTVGLTYEGRTGKPYSWTFNNDLNGDSAAGNDLMYIPTAPGSGEVVFAGGAAEEARFWSFVNANPDLNAARGKVVSRNASFSPFVNSFDLRLSQELPGLMPKHRGVFTLDILNFGNLLNKRWGRIDEVLFQSAGGPVRSFVNYKGVDANGKYIYSLMSVAESLETRQTRGESQWAVQMTLKYEF